MPLTVIDHVNMLGRAKHSLLVYTDCNYTPNVGKAGDEDESVVSNLDVMVPCMEPFYF
jgi:hypothetical protein